MLLVIGPQVWPLVKLTPSAQEGAPWGEGAGKWVLAGPEESAEQPVPGGEPQALPARKAAGAAFDWTLLWLPTLSQQL